MIERKLKHNIWFRLCLDIIIIIIIKESIEDELSSEDVTSE